MVWIVIVNGATSVGATPTAVEHQIVLLCCWCCWLVAGYVNVLITWLMEPRHGR